MITPSDEYFFDLRGYTVIPQALARDHVASINAWIDALPPLKTGEWVGHVYIQSGSTSFSMGQKRLFSLGEEGLKT